MKTLIFATLAIILPGVVTAVEEIPSAHALKALGIYRTIIGIESSKNLGNVRVMADYLAAEWYRQVKCLSLVESANEYLQTPPLSARYHFLCRLALLQIQSQPPRMLLSITYLIWEGT